MTIIQQDVHCWFVWTKAGWPPRYAHGSAAAAHAEAARLAAKHPGKKFLVLTGWAKYVAVPDADEHHVTTHRRAFAQEAA